MKKYPMLLACLVLAFMPAKAQTSSGMSDEEAVRKVADKVLSEAIFEFESVGSHKTFKSAVEIPDSVNVKLKSNYAGWSYPNGVLNMALVNLSTQLNDPKYVEHVKKQIAFVFDNYKVFEQRWQKIKTQTSDPREFRKIPYYYFFQMSELDHCGAMGASVMDIYPLVNRKEYKAYIDKAANHISNIQDRFPDGTLARKGPNPLTLWADDLYMSVPFLARMGKLSGDNKYFDDAVKQILNFTKYLWDDNEQIYYHCYYNDLQRNGVAHWGRCNGWVMLAQVHLLNLMPENHPQRKAILNNLERQILGVAKYQGPEGLWHQVLDRTDSYLESSCTAMFVYGIARAVNQGWIDKRYASIALVGWEGLKSREITPEGYMKDVCVGTGISNDIAFYYNRPAPLNDTHGLGAFIDAGIEIMKLKKSMPQRR